MKRVIFAALAALSFNLASAAEPGAYVSVSAGSGEQKLSAEGVSITDNATAFQLAAGYRYTPYVGAEIGYTNLGKASISGDGLTVSSKPQSIHLAVTGNWDVGPQFAVTGKLGLAHNRTKLEASAGGLSESDTESKNSLFFGVGVAYTFAPNAAVIVDYQNFGKLIKEDGADLKGHVVSAGLRYNF